MVVFAGLVERVDGKLTVTVPLAPTGGLAGELVECSRGMGEVRGDELIIELPEWLALTLSITEGSMVILEGKDGKFKHSEGPDQRGSVETIKASSSQNGYVATRSEMVILPTGSR